MSAVQKQTPSLSFSENNISTRYQISDSEDSEAESDSGKRIPQWAKGPTLQAALHAQSILDPDHIFNAAGGTGSTCDLTAIFQKKTKKLVRRTSSANWVPDRSTLHEKNAYRKDMGFVQDFGGAPAQAPPAPAPPASKQQQQKLKERVLSLEAEVEAWKKCTCKMSATAKVKAEEVKQLAKEHLQEKQKYLTTCKAEHTALVQEKQRYKRKYMQERECVEEKQRYIVTCKAEHAALVATLFEQIRKQQEEIEARKEQQQQLVEEVAKTAEEVEEEEEEEEGEEKEVVVSA
jgi:hypothetical protein